MTKKRRKHRRHLPEEFEFSHQYCLFLHDQLVGTLKSGENADIFNTVIRFNDKPHIEDFKSQSNAELFEWLESNDYREKVVTLYYKQLCAALLSDFVHFIYESLECSEKGKLAVSYALLRKSLKENLFYMEWLLARPKDFLIRFEKNDPKRFKLPYPETPSESEHIKIIEEAVNSTKMGKCLDASLLHELRFQKQSSISLEPTWQKATHLVTTFRHMETESCNLNFIFSDDESRYSQWIRYYSHVPMLLFHAVEVVEALISRFASRDSTFDILPLRSYAGMMLHLHHRFGTLSIDEIVKDFGELLEETGARCTECNTAWNCTYENVLLLYEDGSMLCPNGCDG